MRILLIEDDIDVAATVGEYLEGKGHDVQYAYDGRDGLHRADSAEWDAVVLDLGLPGMDGIEVCRRLREGPRGETPVLMLTARDALEDRLQGFRVGTDDYLIKPFAMAELEARLEALDRRARSEGTVRDLKIADLTLNVETRQVNRGGTTIALNRACTSILEVLMRSAPAVVPRESLAQTLWGDDDDDREVLRTHIYHLRRAVDRPFDSKLLHTVHGVGYRLADLREEA